MWYDEIYVKEEVLLCLNFCYEYKKGSCRLLLNVYKL